MKKILTITCCALVMVGIRPSMAEEQPKLETPQQETSSPDDLSTRLELSRELHDIRHVKDQILRDIDLVSKSLPIGEQEDFKKYMELKVDFNSVEEKSVEMAAEIYTAKELKAMIAYFGSDIGRSAEQKGELYGEKFGSYVRKKIDEAMMAAKFDKIDSSPKMTPSINMLGKE